MGRHIRALLIPSDGTPMHLIQLKTILIPPGSPSGTLGHHPDLRKYWGPSGWERRIATPLTITDSSTPRPNGKYWLFRTQADAHLELNKHVGEGCFGDAFVVKVVDDGGDERGDAGFIDVEREVVASGRDVVVRIVEKLREPAEI